MTADRATHPPIVLVILDGLGDRASDALDGRTPSEAAHTPVLDALTRRGENGVLVPFGPGRATSSEVSHWSLFGFEPVAFAGRAALEALGVGLDPPAATPLFHLALRASEVRDGALWLGVRARRGDDDADTDALFESLDGRTVDGITYRLLPLRTGECVLVAEGAPTHAVSDSDALFDTRHPWMRPQPLPEAPDPAQAAMVATSLEHWLLESRQLLVAHPVNHRRRRDGRTVLDVAVTKWASWIDPAMPNFEARTGLRGGAVTDTALYRGFARLLGLQATDRAYDAADPGGDMRARLDLADALLESCDFVHVHIKATDEAGHSKNPAHKRDVIEAVDAGLAPLLALAERAVVAVTGDHATPSVGPLLHSGDPTPFVVAGPGVRPDAVSAFGEQWMLGGALGRLAAGDVLPLLAGHANRPFFLGHRPGPYASVALPGRPDAMPPSWTGATTMSDQKADAPTHPIEAELRPPERLASVLSKIDTLYRDEVAPREARLRHRLTDERAYLDSDGKLHPEIIGARREIMRASGQAGVYSLHLPERLGGGGLGREDMIYVEEKVYGYGVGLNPALLSWSEGATPRLLYCHDHQREQFVDPLVRGEKTSLHGVTEEGAGSNLFDMKTRGEKRGGDWILNGAKAYITNAFDADVAQVLAITHPGQGRRSFTYFMFDTREYLDKGYRIGRLYQTMFGDGYTGEIFFDDMRLPESAVIGEPGQGFDIAVMSFNYTRMRRGGMCSGWSRYLIERSLERVRQRQVGNRPLGANQGIQWMIADMYIDWLQARSLSLEVARAIDTPGPWYALPRPKDEVRKICALKVSNDESFHRVADRALQVFGGAGVMRNSDINKLFQIARNFRIPGGTDEVQRTTIAETLGLRFEPSKSASDAAGGRDKADRK